MTFDYETLDKIADLYVPFLAVLSLGFLFFKIYKNNFRDSLKDINRLLLAIFLAYGFMFIDSALGIWSWFNMDYSTHTAVSLVLVMFLTKIKKEYRIFFISSLITYFLLMLYQGYHSIQDILTTSIIIGSLYYSIISI